VGGWMRLFRRKSLISAKVAEEVATAMWNEFVLDEYAPRNVGVPEELAGVYEDKNRVYKSALVLLNLVALEGTRSEIGLVTRAYERLFLPQTPTPAGLRILANVKEAMADLGRLMGGESAVGSMNWAESWLANMGVEQRNPVILALFARYWMDAQIMCARVLSEVGGTRRR